MIILQTKFYTIPIIIENITASAHITYYAHITPFYPTYGIRGRECECDYHVFGRF